LRGSMSRIVPPFMEAQARWALNDGQAAVELLGVIPLRSKLWQRRPSVGPRASWSMGLWHAPALMRCASVAACRWRSSPRPKSRARKARLDVPIHTYQRILCAAAISDGWNWALNSAAARRITGADAGSDLRVRGLHNRARRAGCGQVTGKTAEISADLSRKLAVWSEETHTEMGKSITPANPQGRRRAR